MTAHSSTETTPPLNPNILTGAELVRALETDPPRPLIRLPGTEDALINEGDILTIHGATGVAKTYLAIEMAVSLASGDPFFGLPVAEPRRVLFMETEMSLPAIAKRLRRRSPDGGPERLLWANAPILNELQRGANIARKVEVAAQVVAETGAEVLILDTVNPFFRGRESPNAEEHAGELIDRLRAIPDLVLRVLVRHERKSPPAVSATVAAEDSDPASKVRGSGVFGDVSDLMLGMKKRDRRVSRFTLSVTKCRHSATPEDIELWLDAAECRLVAVPPPVYLLLAGAKTRTDLLAEMERRFSVSGRMGDELIKAEEPYLVQTTRGHERLLALDSDNLRNAPWFKHLRIDTVGDLQGCKSPYLSLGESISKGER